MRFIMSDLVKNVNSCPPFCRKWQQTRYFQIWRSRDLTDNNIHCRNMLYTRIARVTVEDSLSETELSGPPSFLMFSLFLKELIFIFLFVVFICCHCSWCCAVWQP